MIEHGSFLEAFYAIQGELPDIRKDSVADRGNAGRTLYANLKTVTDAVLPLLQEHGLIWSTQPTMLGDKPVLRYELTHLTHTEHNPQQRGGNYPIFGDNKPTSFGAAITYGRRYALCAILGLTPDNEEDAEGATPGAARKVTAPRKRPAAPTTDPDMVPGTPLPGEPQDVITPPQMKAIFAVLKDLGVTEANRHAKTNEVLAANNLPTITSFKDLTQAAGRVLYTDLRHELDLRTTGAVTP